MNTATRNFSLALVGLCLAGTAGAAESFDRYQVILERKPFGEPPPVAAPAPAPVVETPPWAEAYRLCSVYEDSRERVQVALLDIKTQKPVMLTLGDGPTPNEGIQLLSASVEEEEATLEKDGESVTMKLSASTRPPPKKKVDPRTAAAKAKAQSAAGAKPPASATPQPNLSRPRGVMRSGR